MTQKKILPDIPGKAFWMPPGFARILRMNPGVWILLAVIVLAAFIASYEWGQSPRSYMLGEIAESDIIADYAFSLQNHEATRLRREAVQKAQPLICTLNTESVDVMHARIRDWLLEALRAEEDPQAMLRLRLEVSEALGMELSERMFSLMVNPDFQNLLENVMLPWATRRLRAGVVPDARKLAYYSGGVIIRDLNGGQETLLPDSRHIQDLKDFAVDLELEARAQPTSLHGKRLFVLLLGNLAETTLTLNEEATLHRSSEAAKNVRPVVQHIKVGEILARQGEAVDAETLAKLDALWAHSAARFKPQIFLGGVIFGAISCLGLFYSPGRRKGYDAGAKELIFVGILVIFMTLLAKFFYFIGFALNSSILNFSLGTQAFAVPVAGAAGLAGLTLSRRRYFTISMLLSIFCTITAQGGMGLFLFYFITSLLCTWLITDSQNRKEVVMSLFPLCAGFLALWLGAALLRVTELDQLPGQGLAMLMGAFFSILLIFAISPLVEILFGFTTRFVLMELMNQEHPLLRQLMLDAPGTYHHSIIVANLVEPAAKAIGAHSLLCKVGAMYHDIGKTDKADYFIENQFKGQNPHDRLTPAMSVLVLTSHVKRGVEMAQQHKLGDELQDIIQQHHGTSLIRYFYHKASLQNQNVHREDFSYAGPKPQSREAALLLLADVLEASSRALVDPTPHRISTHVNEIIQNVLAEGQLDNTELTLKDLDLVRESFLPILTGIFHKRIEYPGKTPLQAEPEPPPVPDRTPGKRVPSARRGGRVPAISRSRSASLRATGNKPGT
ncbi:MAG: HDIG domain-containing protein [Desulfovibrionaceae bacterium]|nr:HDIG domain-containing protein [Desulfovibrionaceae bacterium]